MPCEKSTLLCCFRPKIHSVAHRDRPILLWVQKESGNVRYLWCSSVTVPALLFCIRLFTHVHTGHDRSRKQSYRMWKMPRVCARWPLNCCATIYSILLLFYDAFHNTFDFAISQDLLYKYPHHPHPHWLYFPPTSDLTWTLPVSVSSVNV